MKSNNCFFSIPLCFLEEFTKRFIFLNSIFINSKKMYNQLYDHLLAALNNHNLNKNHFA